MKCTHAGHKGREYVLILSLLLILMFSISCRLTILGADTALRGHDTSVAAMLLDAGRRALSAYFFEIAEIYFHAGMERRRPLAFTDTIYQQWLAKISPREHVHRHGREVDEIMPWMWLAVRADPSNVEHYLTVAFWLAHEIGRNDLAHAVLAEARWKNSFNYKIALEDAVLYLREGRNEKAMSLFNTALAFWPHPEQPGNPDAQLEKARAFLFRALLHETSGNNAQAINDLEAILALFPGRDHLKNRISELAKGNAPSLLASAYWNDILRQESAKKDVHTCGYDCVHGEMHSHHDHNH